MNIPFPGSSPKRLGQSDYGVGTEVARLIARRFSTTFARGSFPPGS